MNIVTDYGAAQITKHLFGLTTMPASFGIALLTGRLDATAGSETVVSLEPPTSAGYARANLTRNATNFLGGDNDTVSTNVEIQYGPATADWDIIVGFALTDTSGIPYFFGDFANPRRVLNGQYLVVSRGGIMLALNSYIEPAIG